MKGFWDLTVDERQELAKNDPEKLNELAEQQRQQHYDEAPDDRTRTRLQGIQNEVDRKMSKIKDPLVRAAKMSEMMLITHDTGSLEHLRGALNEAANVVSPVLHGISPPIPKEQLNTADTATVLPFNRKSEDEGQPE